MHLRTALHCTAFSRTALCSLVLPAASRSCSSCTAVGGACCTYAACCVRNSRVSTRVLLSGLQKRVGRGEESCRLLLSRFIPSPGGPLHAVPFRTEHQPGPRPAPPHPTPPHPTPARPFSHAGAQAPRAYPPPPLSRLAVLSWRLAYYARIVHSSASCYIAVMSQVKLVTIYINRMAQARTVRSGALR